MFDEIKQNSELFELIRYDCSENRISAEFDQHLTEDEYIILKPDVYYNAIKFATPPPPPSVDCLIIVKCDSNQGYDFYLIELKNIKSKSGFDIENIKKKFQTVIEDFLKHRFKDIFLNNSYNINNLYLLFASDPYRFGNITQEEYNERKNDERVKTKGLRLKISQLVKPLEFKGKIAFINHSLPHLIQITPC